MSGGITAPWPEDREAKLRLLLAEDLTASQIAGEIGDVSRNAVIGKVARLGLQLPNHGVHGQRARELEPLPPDITADSPLPGSRLLTLVELDEANHCHWPLGDPRDPAFRYCAADRDENAGQPYCSHHYRMGRNR